MSHNWRAGRKEYGGVDDGDCGGDGEGELIGDGGDYDDCSEGGVHHLEAATISVWNAF